MTQNVQFDVEATGISAFSSFPNMQLQSAYDSQPLDFLHRLSLHVRTGAFTSSLPVYWR